MMRFIIITISALYFFLTQVSFAQTDSLNISWDRNAEQDSVEYYILLYAYSNAKTTFSNQEYDTLEFINQTPFSISRVQTVDTDTAYIKPGNFVSYRVIAVDSQGIPSDFSDPAGAGIPQIRWQQTEIDSGKSFPLYKSDFLVDLDNNPTDLMLDISQEVNITITQITNGIQLEPSPITFTGQARFRLGVTDPDGFHDNKLITVNIVNTNKPPVITHIPDQIVTEGTAFSPLSLDDYVQDPDHTDNELSWSYSGNDLLTVTIDPQRILTVNPPDVDWYGSETVIFTVRDPGGLTDGDTVIFRVTPVNDPPVVQLNELVLDNGDTQVFDLKLYASDVEDSPLQLQWDFLGYQNFEFSWENSVQKLLRITKTGSVSLESGQFVVTDTGGLSDTANVRIIATDGTPNTPPSLAYLPSIINIAEDSNTLVQLDQFIVDSTNAFSELSWEFIPGNFIEYTYDATHASLMIFAEPDWNGHSDFRIRVTDPQGLSDEKVLDIMVNPRVDLRRIAFNTSFPGQVQVAVETDQGSQVEMSFWVNPSLKSTYKSINFLNNHRFSLQNLTPDTTYRYVLTLSDTSGFSHTYGDSTFSTGLNQLAEEGGSDILVYPNPFRPSRGHVVVVFDNLPQQMKELLVMTTSGEVVFDKVFEGVPIRRLPWTVVNKNGEQLASGLYLYVIKGENGKKLKAGKLAVIR